MKSFRIFVLVAVIVFAFPLICMAQYCTPGWSSAPADISYNVTRAGGGAWYNYVFIWGGVDETDTPQTATSRYRTDSNTWNTMAAMPENKYYMASAIVGDFGYAIAGWNGVFSFTDNCYEYDILGNSWSAIAVYPIELASLACAGDGDDKLYCFGGSDISGDYNNSYVYDPDLDTWSAIANLPVATSGHAATYNEGDGLIYITGGWPALSATYAYDPVGNSYTTLGSINTARFKPLLAAGNGVVWLTGGGDEYTPVTTNDEYLSGNTWTDTGISIPTDLLYMSGGFVPWSGIYSIGGMTASSVSTAVGTNQVWNPCLPQYKGMDPTVGVAGDSVTIYGEHFEAGGDAWLYDSAKAVYSFSNLSIDWSGEMTADIPAGLEEGMYGIAIAGTAGQTIMVDGAFYASGIAEEIVYDDGDSVSGIAPAADGSQYVQGFTLGSYPAKLKRVYYYSNSYTRINQPMILVVYMNGPVAGKAAPAGLPVYTSDPIWVQFPGQWNAIDLSQIPALQNNPIEGEFFIGVEGPVFNASNGPYIKFDSEGVPNDKAWLWDGANWTNMSASMASDGSFMYRPTVEPGCMIDSVYYDHMEANPASDCQFCDVNADQEAWSDVVDDELCDDGEWCTENDKCTSGECGGDLRDCDDGDFCTGTEICNDDTDACDSTGDPCEAAETCNEDTDACDPATDDDDDDSVDDDDATDDDDTDDDDATPSSGDDDDDDGGCCG